MKRDTAMWSALAGGTALGALAIRSSLAEEERAETAPKILTAPGPGRGLPVGGLPRKFDRIFAEHGHGIPLPYLRALAKRESDMNPEEQSGPAWGLLQVIEVVRRDFNELHDTDYERSDLLDPVVNVTIATDLLRRIIDSYEDNHPDVPDVQEEWLNLRFVELLTFGWNAGWSERAGVGRVVSLLEHLGQYEVTIDTVHDHAAMAGASRHLRNPAKVRWCKSVAALYARERALEIRLA